MPAGLTLGASQGPIHHPHRGLHTQGLGDDAVKLQTAVQRYTGAGGGGQCSDGEVQESQASGGYSAAAAAAAVGWKQARAWLGSEQVVRLTLQGKPASPRACPNPTLTYCGILSRKALPEEMAAPYSGSPFSLQHSTPTRQAGSDGLPSAPPAAGRQRPTHVPHQPARPPPTLTHPYSRRQSCRISSTSNTSFQ